MKNPILLLLAIFSIMPSFSTERDTTVIFNQLLQMGKTIGNQI